LVGPLLAALDRITAEGRETSRDPRVALLERLAEMGSARYAPRLGAYRTDFDSSVAQRAAAILTTWSGQPVRAEPRPLPRPREALDELMTGAWRARITMAAPDKGGTFEVLLFPREAPYTVARFVRQARSRYYDGLTFHRVEPGFVIQGGSPAATEYVGDGPFMRDELGTRSHTRGTLGISTRGRDTGDAQIFVNLIDNFRLDHDYTVFGEIVRGREVAERVLEGDVIARVEIVRSP
jgi:cyclophilin family peptidyl-prolyl cis-trans isomerase